MKPLTLKELREMLADPSFDEGAIVVITFGGEHPLPATSVGTAYAGNTLYLGLDAHPECDHEVDDDDFEWK
jgi:hypothetical protein